MTNVLTIIVAACIFVTTSSMTWAYQPSATPPAEKDDGLRQKPTRDAEPKKNTHEDTHDRTGKEADGAVDLRPKYVAGRETRYTMHSTSKSSTKPLNPKGKKVSSPPASDNELEQEIGLLIRTVAVHDDGSADLQVVYESLKIRGKGDLDIDFDSTKAARQPQAPDDVDMIDFLLRGIVGTTLTLKADANGNISSLSGGDALDMLANSPFQQDSDIGGLLAQSPGAGGGNMNWLAGSTTEGNPGRRDVGERWTNKDKLAGTPIGQFDMVTTHTLKRLRGNIAEIEFTSVLESGASQAAKQKGAQIEQAQSSGKYLWDTARGELDEMTSEQTSVIEFGSGDEAQKLTSTQTVRVERREK